MSYLTINNYKKLEDVLNDTDGYITIYEHEDVYSIYVTLKIIDANLETNIGKILIKIMRESNENGNYTIVIVSKNVAEIVTDITFLNNIQTVRDWISTVSRMLINTDTILYV